MHLFYTPEITGDLFQLPEEESKHAIRVLRLKVGDRIILIDGKGGYYEASIVDDNAKHCTVSILESKLDYGKREFSVEIAVAPTKHMDRLEWFLEKAVETGISSLHLLQTTNSERVVVKTERLKKVAISAMKQSLKAYLPEINELENFSKFLQRTKDFKGQKFIAHCMDTEKKHLKDLYSKGNSAMILIGPEGDFTDSEVKMAVKNGFIPVGLGTSRLRTETAALYACMAVNILNE